MAMIITKMQRLVVILVLLLILFQCLLNLGISARIPATIVFGDSTVDAGNNNYIATIATSNFPPYGQDFPGGVPTGRFCNGRLATDFISEGLRLGPIVPAYLDPAYNIRDFAKGVCFASAGAGFDNATSDLLSAIPLWKQVEYFKDYQRRLRRSVGSANAKHIVNEAVYTISIGTNDFILNYYALVSGRFKQYTIVEFEDYILSLAADFLTDMYRLGARKISFVALSPMGCVPLERTANVLHGGSCNEDYNKVAREFNVKLQAKIRELCSTLPGIRLKYTSPYEILTHAITDPSVYGLENVQEGCCGTGKLEMAFLCNDLDPSTCPDPDKYLFWDAVHPTEKANRILAAFMLNTTLAEFL